MATEEKPYIPLHIRGSSSDEVVAKVAMITTIAEAPTETLEAYRRVLLMPPEAPYGQVDHLERQLKEAQATIVKQGKAMGAYRGYIVELLRLIEIYQERQANIHGDLANSSRILSQHIDGRKAEAYARLKENLTALGHFHGPMDQEIGERALNSTEAITENSQTDRKVAET